MRLPVTVNPPGFPIPPSMAESDPRDELIAELQRRLDAALVQQRPRAEAVHIGKGDLLVLRDVIVDADVHERMMTELRRIAGHDEFLVLHVYDNAGVATIPMSELDDLLAQLLNMHTPDQEGDTDAPQ